MDSPKLTSRDSSVLRALFDPENSSQRISCVNISISNPLSELDVQSQRQEKLALLLINEEKPSEKNINAAIDIFSNILAENPTYCSAWNNRAQAQRLLFEDDNIIAQPEAVKSIIGDLDTAINLASPQHNNEAVSPLQAKVLASAHTHRGYLLWKASRLDPQSQGHALTGLFAGNSKDRLEHMASKEFALGGKYGNKTAQQFAVKTNPYARLCGSIVREALQQEMTEYYKLNSLDVESRT